MKSIVSAIVLSLASLSAFASSSSGMNWFTERIVSSLIHGFIYGVIFKVLHGLGLVPTLILTAVVLGGAYWFWKKNQRN